MANKKNTLQVVVGSILILLLIGVTVLLISEKTRQQRVGAGIQPGKGRPGKPVHRLRQAVR